MKWYFGSDTKLSLDQKKRALTIGNFDGVHLGHQSLITEVVKIAKNIGGEAGLITFHPHPMEVLFPEKSHHRLFDLEDQKEQMQKCGLDFAWVQPFSREFSEMTYQEFLEDFLWKNFQPSAIVVGYDFSFGRDRKGGKAELQGFCDLKKINLVIKEAAKINGQVVSTTLIRKFLQEGELQKVEAFLGRKYYLKGIVERGEERGRHLGVPTANIHPVVQSYPKLGVYVTRTKVAGTWHNSVTNIGMNKTFVEGDLNPVKVETHILDFAQDIYGSEIKIELIKFLRDERRFPNIEELKIQIKKDIELAQKEFS